MRAPSLLAMFAVLWQCHGARAETLFVDASGTSPFVDIQDAVDAAADGDVVLVFPGTYGPIDVAGKGITVRSVAGPASTTIDATGSGGAAVVVRDLAPADLLLHGFSIVGGEGSWVESIQLDGGGGVLVDRGAGGRISGNVIDGNSAEVGGGIAIVDSVPAVYGNVISSNQASEAGGGAWLFNPTEADTSVLACNAFLGNAGTEAGGLVLLAGTAQVENNVFDGNVGERGGLWAGLPVQGLVANNTLVANQSTSGGAAGIETASETLAFSGNLLAWGQGGWGAIRGSASAPWTWNDAWGNGLGDYSGAAGDPTGLDGNLAVQPDFTWYTPADPFDDDLALLPSCTLLDLGDPSPQMADSDGTRNAIGFQGGPHSLCDLDGDGVRAGEGDCRPSEAGFVPDQLEYAEGLDRDCDGWGAIEVLDFVAGDGGLVPGGPWEFGPPALLPGRGHQGLDAWCTGCVGGTSGEEAVLGWVADLAAVPAGTPSELRLVHAWDVGSEGGAAKVEAFDPSAGTWEELASFDGQANGWTVGAVDLASRSGQVTDLRFRLLALPAGTPGWSIGRVELRIADSDGDGRSAVVTDCDDGDAQVYEGAPEIPYDGLDQDCDGADLVDADGDGIDGVAAGGGDCDDGDAQVFPGAPELPYDGLDQDCDGSDLVDADGDGHDGADAGGADCDDLDPDAFPGAPEEPYDGVDQDCDGADLVDVDGDGASGDEAPPYGDCDDFDPDVHPGAVEVCGDGVDGDCDGLIDVLPDLDEDGWDPCSGDCDDGRPEVHPGAGELCDGFDGDCDGIVPGIEADADFDGEPACAGDCDDADPGVASSLPELCDGFDNDCDLAVDEDHDADGDGFSGCGADCDDLRSAVHPGGAVVCDDPLDEDCDGVADADEEECQGGDGCACAGSLPGGPVPGRPSAVLAALLAIAALGRRVGVARRPPQSSLDGAIAPC